MSSCHSSMHQSGSSSKKEKSSPSSKQKAPADDWTDVTAPEERRRIQNRNAQRKFRQKQRTQKETEVRDDHNKKYADGAYARPGGDDIPAGGSLPWGDIPIDYIIKKGNAESVPQQGGSHWDTSQPYDTNQYYNPALYDTTGGYPQQGSYAGGDSSGDDHYQPEEWDDQPQYPVFDFEGGAGESYE